MRVLVADVGSPQQQKVVSAVWRHLLT